MKQAMVFVMGIVAMLGGIGGWFMYNDQAQAGEAEAAPVVQTQMLPSPNYVQFSPIVIPIFDKSKGAKEILTLVVAVEVNDTLSEKAVVERRLRLTDAFIRDMYGAVDKTHFMDENGILSAERIRSRLNKVSKTVLGESVQSTVLLSAFQQRPI